MHSVRDARLALVVSTVLLAALAPACNQLEQSAGDSAAGDAADVPISDTNATDGRARDVVDARIGPDRDAHTGDAGSTDAGQSGSTDGGNSGSTDAGNSGSTDAGMQCGAGEMLCGSPPMCVSTGGDPNNCGRCGVVCGSAFRCVGGNCMPMCEFGMCGGQCTDTQHDPNNCGSCSNVCPAGSNCSAGLCMCLDGSPPCNNACPNVQTDSANCGSCGHACGANESCSGGTCVPNTVCGPPPSGVSANAAEAYMRENEVRAAMGIPCARMDTNANQGADNHCAYYSSNRGTSCTSNPHVEVSGCSGFTGANFWERMAAAGYSGSPAFEDMAFVDNGAAAVQMWIDSVWHRTPVLSPWIADIGYGSASGCDTMDFGSGSGAPYDTVATYPYNNQTGVPTAFYGNEGPPPPAPPGGFPSGYPIHVYIQGTITSHQFTVDGSSTPIDGVWLSPGDPNTYGLIRTEYVFYANTPLTSGTRYRFTATGSNSAGAVNVNTVFTTQ